MSLFGALNTAITGLSSQSAAFGNISDNIANSQTVGFKRTDTSFVDYLTESDATVNDPGSVVALPEYTNNVQGTIAQSSDPLALAITGAGFFPISQATTTTTTGLPTFSPVQAYTRAGDFEMDRNGYLVNSAGNYLNGWAVNSTTGAVDQNALAPVRVSQTAFNPVATSNVSLSANLPATPTAGSTISSQVQVYDSLGTAHTIILNWSQVAGTPNTWTAQIVSPDDQNPAPTSAVTDASGNPVIGTVDVTFGTNGTIQSLSNAVSDYGAVSVIPPTATAPAAQVSFNTELESGISQPITLNLGNIGESNGVTQFAGTTYTLGSINQDGVPPGNFSNVSVEASGDIVINYDNGQSRTIGQVPVVTFNNPNGLQKLDGQAFTATADSGSPVANPATVNGAGALITGSLEQSNVDIASEFTKLIVAQNAYSANTKVITTSNQLLQETISIIS